MKSKKELIPCIVCGARPVLECGEGYYLKCPNCGFRTEERDSEAKARTLWRKNKIYKEPQRVYLIGKIEI